MDVYGLSIDGETMYSTDPKFVAVEALAYMGLEMDFTAAIKAYEYNYEGEDRSVFDKWN